MLAAKERDGELHFLLKKPVREGGPGVRLGIRLEKLQECKTLLSRMFHERDIPMQDRFKLVLGLIN